MYGDDRVPFVFGHIDQHTITQNARIIHNDVKFAKSIDRRIDHVFSPIKITYVVAVCYGFPTSSINFVSYLLRRRSIFSPAIDSGPKVVDDNLGARPR